MARQGITRARHTYAQRSLYVCGAHPARNYLRHFRTMHHWSPIKFASRRNSWRQLETEASALGETKRTRPISGLRRVKISAPLHDPTLPATPRHDLWIIFLAISSSRSKYYFSSLPFLSLPSSVSLSLSNKLYTRWISMRVAGCFAIVWNSGSSVARFVVDRRHHTTSINRLELSVFL